MSPGRRAVRTGLVDTGEGLIDAYQRLHEDMRATLDAVPVTRTRGTLLVLGAGLLWSTIPLAVRLTESATAVQIVFYRALVQVPLLVTVLAFRYRGRIWPPIRAVGFNGVWGGLALAISYLTAIESLAHTTVGNAVFVFSTAPLMSALLGRIVLGEKVKPITWLAMALAACGVLIMSSTALDGGRLTGNLLAAVASVGYAAFTVSLRRGQTLDMVPTIALSGVFSVVLGALIAGSLMVPAVDIAISAYMGAFGLTLGLLLYTLGSKVLTAAELPLVAMVEVVLAPLWVWLVVGEATSGTTLIGGVVVLTAVLMQGFLGFRRNRAPMPLGT